MNEPDTKKYEWLDQHLINKPYSVREFKAEWDCFRYMIGGKMFAMIGGDKAGKSIVTLKCEPLEGDFLLRQYPDITHGYYMNKTHWRSVYLEGSTPDEVLRDMADKAYALVFASLPKKTQRGLSHED